MYSSSLQLGSMPREGLLVLYCNDIYIFWFDCIKPFLSGRSITPTQQVYAMGLKSNTTKRLLETDHVSRFVRCFSAIIKRLFNYG